MGVFGKVWEGSGKFRKVSEGLGRFGMVSEGFRRFGKIWEGLGRFGKVSEGVGLKKWRAGFGGGSAPSATAPSTGRVRSLISGPLVRWSCVAKSCMIGRAYAYGLGAGRAFGNRSPVDKGDERRATSRRPRYHWDPREPPVRCCAPGAQCRFR